MCRGECNNKTCTCKYSDTKRSSTNEVLRQLFLMSCLGFNLNPTFQAECSIYHLATEVRVHVLQLSWLGSKGNLNMNSNFAMKEKAGKPVYVYMKRLIRHTDAKQIPRHFLRSSEPSHVNTNPIFQAVHVVVSGMVVKGYTVQKYIHVHVYI